LAEDHITRWQSGDVRDMYSEMTDLALKTAAAVLLGNDLEGGATELAGAVRIVIDRFREEFPVPGFLSILLPRSIPTASRRRLIRAIATIDTTIGQMIDAARERPRARTELISRLLGAQSTSTLGTRGIRDQAVTLLLAGHETAACALTWIWYLLAHNQSAVDRLQTELDLVLQGRLPRFDDLPRLAFTRQVVLEAMRLYPPGWGMNRRAICDCEIGGQQIKRGHYIAMSQWVVHRDPRFYYKAEQFRPERWAEDAARRLPKFAYFPFGGGQRLCIGRDLAMLETTLIVATIARRFRLCPGATPLKGVSPSISLRPAGPMRLLVAALPRKSAQPDQSNSYSLKH
jgi:cytochrome P450